MEGIIAQPKAIGSTMRIKGVPVKLIATPTKTWDLEIRGTVFHITYEQEEELLRTALYEWAYPEPEFIEGLERTGKKQQLPSPALIWQMTIIKHDYVDAETNRRKPCKDVFGIRGFGYMTKWQAFVYGLPYALALLMWGSLTILSWDILKWIFTAPEHTPFFIPDPVCNMLIVLGAYITAELCFKPGRKYLKGWFLNKEVIIFLIYWLASVFAVVLDRMGEHSGSLIAVIILFAAIIGTLLVLVFSAFATYDLIHWMIVEGEGIGTIDEYL